eukprot:4809959-Pyramimonas_sp.AAC.1
MHAGEAVDCVYRAIARVWGWWGDATHVCTRMHAPSRTPVSSTQPGIHMHAPSRTLVSSAHPPLHPHAPSRTPVSSAQP